MSFDSLSLLAFGGILFVMALGFWLMAPFAARRRAKYWHVNYDWEFCYRRNLALAGMTLAIGLVEVTFIVEAVRLTIRLSAAQ